MNGSSGRRDDAVEEAAIVPGAGGSRAGAGRPWRFRPVTWLAIGFVKAWRLLISPLYGNVCKYKPSCSAYGLRALQVHGVVRATPLIVWRILRCNPWSNGGYDPVPGTPEAREWAQRQAGRDAHVASDEAVADDATAAPTGVPTSSPGGDDAQLNEVRADAGRHRPEDSGPATVPGPVGPDDATEHTAAMNHPRTSRSGEYLRDDGHPSVAVYAR